MDRNDLIKKRAELLAQAEAALTGAMNEGRGLTDGERSAYNRAMEQASELEGLIRAMDGVRAAQADSPAPPHIEDPSIGLEPREVERYSILRAIRAVADNDWSKAPLEKKASDAVAKKLGKEPRGFYVPFDILEARASNVVKGTDSAGGYLVATEQLSMIEMLRNRAMVRAAGARVLAGLIGDIAIPKLTGGATMEWLAEDGSSTASGQTFAQVTMAPKTAAVSTQISRKMLLQSSEDIEMLVRDDLARVLALGIDYAALHGDGASNNPTGIQNTSGVATVAIGTDGGALAWSHVVQLETEIAQDNADLGTLAYMTNAKVRGSMKTTEKVSGYPTFLWGEGSTPVNGYPCLVTNQVRSNLTKGTGTSLSAMFFGNWSDLLIGIWGGMDILVDPYSAGASGAVVLRIFQDADIAIRHPESFSQILDIVTS